MDQQIVFYKPRLKSRRWPVRVFLHFIQICAFNAFVLYRQDKAPKLRFLKFTEKLMDKLGVSCLKKAGRKVSPAKAAKKAREQSRYSGCHEPYFYRRSHGEATGDVRKVCRICKFSKVPTGCFECDVGLCLKTCSTEDSCFQKYHDKNYV